MGLRLIGTPDEPEFLFLPWSTPLEQWPDDTVVALPRGISRHVVRFVRINKAVYAVKEVEQPLAEREYALLFELGRLDVPCVEPVGIVTGREDRDGEPLAAALVTRHLRFSLPYRALFSSTLRDDTANRLMDALTVLLVRLHLVGFSWNDCSLSNTLFLRDAGAFAAYLVDAETGELHDALSDGQRRYDLETAATNVAGELMDLAAGGRLHESIDPIQVGVSLMARYDALWSELTEPLSLTAGERYLLDARIRRLNSLGFDVAELQVHGEEGGARVSVRPKVVDAGHHSRRLLRLTGLDVQENQARRLLNDLDTFRADEHPDEDEEIVAHLWVTQRFEPVVRSVPTTLRGKLEPAEVFHEVLEHRWFLSERQGRDVGLLAGARDYVDTVLAHKPDEQAVLGARPGVSTEDTAELRIVLPPE
ncbi:MAG: DUF4032 domain-containing protein [Candidatus Nanopelagicales bacterium]